MLNASQASVAADSPELRLALSRVKDFGDRERTRIVCVYGLSPQIDDPADHGSLPELYEFGRFSPHVENEAELLPHPVLDRKVSIELPGDTQDLGPARVILMITPRGDAALVIDAKLNGDPDGQRVAQVLGETCQDRDELRIDGKPITDWLREQAAAAGLKPSDKSGDKISDLSLGPNVHQCVFPGGELLKAIRGGETYWRLIYRVAASQEPSEQAGIFRPAELNYRGFVALGHGRGVSVIAGFAEQLENTYALMAVILITGLGVLHRSRRKLFETMKQASQPIAKSTADARTDISRLSARLNELQLDLEFGVEFYLDSVLIPESIVEAFQRSLCDAIGISAGLEHSSRMLERLSAIIQARRVALDAAIQEQTERRDRLFTTLLAVGTLLALPPALLLSFFALQPDAHQTLFKMDRHWGAYLLAWLPFIALVVVGWIFRRRIRASSTQLGEFEEARSPSAQ